MFRSSDRATPRPTDTSFPLSPRRLSAASARHPWRTIGLWAVVVVAITLLSSAFGEMSGGDSDGFTNRPEALVGEDLIAQHFGEDDRETETIVIQGQNATVDDPAFEATVQRTIAGLGDFGGDIAEITDYYALRAAGVPEAEELVSQDRHTLIIPVTFGSDSDDLVDRGAEYMRLAEAQNGGDFAVYTVGAVSGDVVYGAIAEEDTGKDISIGLPAAAIILVLVFGALVAAFLPLLLGIVAIATATGLAALLAGVMIVDEVTTVMITMIGLAVGIDYALFFVERYREERRHGVVKMAAIERAGGTAGQAVMFSGGTVILALVGLFLLPIDVFQGMAVGAILAVLVAVAAAVTLLPALLRLLGDWINAPRFGLMGKLKAQDRGSAEAAQKLRARERHGLWARIATLVMRRPVVALLLSGAVLLLAAAPALTMRTGEPGFDSLPETRLKTGYEILAREFYAGMDEPVQVVITGDVAANRAGVAKIVTTIEADGAFGPATTTTSPDGQLTLIEAPLDADPYSGVAMDAVERLRALPNPAALADDAVVYVTGETAFSLDFNTTLRDNTPLVFAFVLGLSFLLLLVAFRSVVVPLKAILLNLLSVGAAYGLTVAVFQHGWGADLLGLTQVEAITSWLPIFLFCILFGLSMDYHVFLLSRIREHYDRTGDNDAAVAAGLQSTGRIITGAALIMVAVFGSFAMGRLADVQQLGFGLAVAVLIDATLVRSVLVPASMKLLGRANWYLPRALRWLPDFRVEGDVAVVPMVGRTFGAAADAGLKTHAQPTNPAEAG